MVVLLALDPRFMDSNLAEDDGFLMEIRIRSAISARGEVKLLVLCKILRYVEETYKYERGTS
jgi:hypothetical protein